MARAVLRLSWVVESELRKHDLTPGQYRVLSQLGAGAAHASAVATQLAIRRPSFSAMADALVGRGWATREVDEGDRRRVTYALTDDGIGVLKAAESGVARRLATAAEVLGDAADTAQQGLVLWNEALARPPRAARTPRRTRAKENG